MAPADLYARAYPNEQAARLIKQGLSGERSYPSARAWVRCGWDLGLSAARPTHVALTGCVDPPPSTGNKRRDHGPRENQKCHSERGGADRSLEEDREIAARDYEGVDPWSGLKFENSALVYRGVSEGVGVAIAQTMFAADDTTSGHFHAPFETCVSNDTDYFLVYPEDRLLNPAAREFREWLLEEMERSRALARKTFPWALPAGAGGS